MKDSFSFVSEITSIASDNDFIRASFDVAILLTNIPLDESTELYTGLLSDESHANKLNVCILDSR